MTVFPPPTDSDKERFFGQSQLNRSDECLALVTVLRAQGLWSKFHFGARNKYILAHRFSYLSSYHGFLPDKLICHTCDTPSCVNPNHLYAGPSADNSRDMAERGRGTCGERNHHAKLTREQVEEIRACPHQQGLVDMLVKKFNVNQSTISRIRTGATWS